MSLKADLTDLLLSDPALADLLGPRITWGRRAPGEGLPAVVLMRVGATRDYHMKGVTTLRRTRIQADILATTLAGAGEVEARLVARLDRIRGPHGGTDFRAIFVEALRDGLDSDRDGSGIHRILADLIIHHRLHNEENER
ncbi:tail completion protein gp17 [Rhodovulum sp. YEN HP10]|uniref:tail completion protein gp17 n=1 Tax=Rhodovulum sp. HP10 TaxID=3387397 RepID=UPI0039DFBEDE